MPIILYGVAIHEAIASGDRKKMQAVAKEAEDYLAQYGDLSAAAEILKSELVKRGEISFPGPIVLYGVVIHQAIASGDVEQMKSAADQAEKHLAEYGDVAGALAALKAEIAKN